MRFAQELSAIEFACGATYYQQEYPDHPDTRDHMVLYAALANKVPVPFVVDTGAPWSILHPEHLQTLDEHIDRLMKSRLSVRGITYDGWLYRTTVTLDPDEECLTECMTGLEVDMTVFVPDDPDYPYPNFLGQNTFLQYIRYAVDPLENAFYFGMD